MRGNKLFQGVAVEDRGLPQPTAEVLVELQGQIRRAFGRAKDEWTKSAGITVNIEGAQMGLDDALRRGLLRIGMVIWMYISWGEALRLDQWGFKPCDGGDGTPPLIPPQGTSEPQRSLVAVKYGQDPYSDGVGNANTGGAATHGHAAHTVEFSNVDNHEDIDFSNADNHDDIDYSVGLSGHTVDFDNVCPHPETGVSSGEDACVLHCCAGSNHDGEQALNHTGTQSISGHSGTQTLNAHAGTQELSHDATSSYHPYAESIPMMRTR